MSVIVTRIDMPKSCDICSYMETNDDLMSSDYRYMYCGQPYMGDYVTDYVACRHPDCPLKSVDGLIEKINHCVDRKLSIALGCNDLNERQKHMEAVNAYQRCISIIKEYCGMDGE